MLQPRAASIARQALALPARPQPPRLPLLRPLPAPPGRGASQQARARDAGYRTGHAPPSHPPLEATQRQIDGFLSQHLYKCYQNRVVSVGNRLEICPWVTSRAVSSEVNVSETHGQ